MPTSNTPVLIRRARLDDAAALNGLMIRMFCETFGPYTPPDDLATYLAETFGLEQQCAEIADANNNVLLAEVSSSDGSSVLVGCAYVVRTVAPEAVTGAEPMELKRVYVDAAWHGRGVAQALMDEVVRCAAAQGGQTLWLGVWEHNGRAQAFYRKHGFERVGEQVFSVGTDLQLDWLMVRRIASGNTVPD